MERADRRDRLLRLAREKVDVSKMYDSYTVLTHTGITARLREDVTSYDGFTLFEIREEGGVLVRESLPRRASYASPYVVTIVIVVNDLDLIATIGPFVRTLVRLMTRVDARRIRVVVDLCGIPLHGRTRNVPHKLVRNSMGAALFLDITVRLPSSAAPFSVDESGVRDTYPTIRVVRRVEADASVPFRPRLTQRCDRLGHEMGVLVPRGTLRGFDPNRHYLEFTIRGRMSTVCLTPVLFQLSNLLMTTIDDDEDSNEDSDDSCTISDGVGNARHVVCVEKVPNLHRVMSLFDTYGRISDLIICTRPSLAMRFAEIVKNDVRIMREKRASSSTCDVVPPVWTIERAQRTLSEMRDTGSTRIVEFDLHERAMTLCSSQRESVAARALRSARSCIIWGFESDGIPKSMTRDDDMRIQIESRSSLNLVASLSIALHASVPS